MRQFDSPQHYTFFLPDEVREITVTCETLEEAIAYLPQHLNYELSRVNGDSRFQGVFFMGEGSGRVFLFQFVTTPCIRASSRLYQKSQANQNFMSFFKHVQLHEYDITDKGISQACYDEMRREGYILPEDELRVLADYKREQFKEYMRPLFA